MTKHTVTLECHHIATFSDAGPPILGDTIYCVRCQAMREVTEAPPEYRIRCLRCTFTRMLGPMRLTAEVKAAGHVRRKAHPVAIYNGHKRIYVMGEKRSEQDTPLPFTTEPIEPPF